mgnify:CR=1 FL=1
MDNIKKLGLTALAGSMVATAAHSAELSASGSWALSYTSEDDDTVNGQAFTMGDSVTFTGSGELDNGFTASVKYELDGGNFDDEQLKDYDIKDRKELTDKMFEFMSKVGGIGLTAISIAIAMHIKCIATVGSDEKYKYLQGLGLERVINYDIDDFEMIIKNEFKGVDVILDMVGGDYFQKNINILTRLGRLLNIAYLKGSKV